MWKLIGNIKIDKSSSKWDSNTFSKKNPQSLVQMYVVDAIHYNGNRFKARETYTLKYYSFLNRFKLFCNR